MVIREQSQHLCVECVLPLRDLIRIYQSEAHLIQREAQTYPDPDEDLTLSPGGLNRMRDKTDEREAQTAVVDSH